MASVNAKSGGSWGTATPYGKVAGSWTAVQSIYEKISGVWTLIWSAMSASASPNSVSGQGSPGTVTTGFTTCTPSGGTSPYTYAWAFVSGDSSVLPTAATSASTQFSATVSGVQTKVAVYKCTVTDAHSNTADSNTVTATVSSNV